MPSWIFAILAVISTAATTLLLREAMHIWPVGLGGILSRCVTVPLLAAWVLAQGSGWRRLRPQGTLGLLLVMSILSIAVNLLWFASLKWTTATNVAMLLSLDLVFVVLLGSAFGLERITLREAALLPSLFIGTALLTGIASNGWTSHLIGDLMAVGVAFSYAINAFVIRRILRSMDGEAVALYNHGLSTLGFVGLAIFAGDFSAANPALSSPTAWGWIIGVGLLGAISLPLYYAALRRLSVWKLRAWLLLAPVIVAIVE